MQAFLLLFGLLFRPGASVRLKTVGESWDGPTLDGPEAIIPLSQLYPALTQDENATWFTIHTVDTIDAVDTWFACWAFPAGGGGSSWTAPALGTSAEPAPASATPPADGGGARPTQTLAQRREAGSAGTKGRKAPA